MAMAFQTSASPKRGGEALRQKRIDGTIKPRKVDPVTCERDYDDDELEFLRAVDEYRRTRNRPFPTWSEVLSILKSLGYEKVNEPVALPANAPRPARTA